MDHQCQSDLCSDSSKLLLNPADDYKDAEEASNRVQTIGEFFISEPEWNIFLYCAGAFHVPHNAKKYPLAFAIKILATVAIVLATFGFCYGIYHHIYLHEHTLNSTVYCTADAVIVLQVITVVVGIFYAVDRMREGLNRAIINELIYVRDKSYLYTAIAIVMCIFTFVVIFINKSTAVSYYSFELSIATIVSSLLVTNMLSLWMVVFIWFDVKSCMIISQKVTALGQACKLTPATYVSAHTKFVRQIDRIASVLDIVVVVAYINTLTYFIMLLIIPSYISVSYLATFGRETVILFMVLPDIATVNDMHTDLVRIIVDKERFCIATAHSSGSYTDTGRSSASGGSDMIPGKSPSVLHSHSGSRGSEGKVPVGDIHPMNKFFGITKQPADIDSVSFSTTDFDRDSIHRLSGLEAGEVNNSNISSMSMHNSIRTAHQYQLYMLVNEYPLQIPIIMKSKVFTQSNIRNQCFGILLAALGLLVKVFVDNRYS